jgi:hypothetical protein
MSRTALKMLCFLVFSTILTVGLSVTAGSTPQASLQSDLVLRWAGQDGLLVYPGYPLSNSVKLTLFNEGRMDAVDFEVDVLLSQTRVPDGKADLLGRLHIPRLKGGSSIPLQFTKGLKIPVNAPFRTLYVVALADARQTVMESSETNNAAALSVLVQMKIATAYQAADSDVCIYIKGNGFGPVWGDNQICLNNTPVVCAQLAMNWKDNQIFFQPQGIACGQNYSLTINRSGIPISNTFTLYVAVAVGWTNYPQGSAGTAITLHGQGFGAIQGGRTLKLGNVSVSAISAWSDGQIALQIPAGLAPGTYQFSVWEGSKCVSVTSQMYKFTVI